MGTTNNWKITLFLLSLVISTVLSGCKKADKIIPVSDIWTAQEDNPVISYGETLDGAFWNHPEIIKDTNGQYQLFMSANYTQSGTEKTAIFRAVSNDGSQWNIGTTPVVFPSQVTSDPDFYSVDDPTVVFFDNMYHMYYTISSKDNPDTMQIGHSISQDGGVTWLKDAPVITPTGVPYAWNGAWVSQPGAVVFQGNVYLYYVGTNWRTGAAQPDLERVIGLSVSSDGFTFDSASVVLKQNNVYPSASDFEGYNHPDPLVKDGNVHLFYDVVMHIKKEDPQSTHIAIHHARSGNGTTFTEDQEALFKRSSFEWTRKEIRSPTVLQDNGEFKMWFGGDHYAKKAVWGIGYASVSEAVY